MNLDNLIEYLFNQSIRSGKMIDLETVENIFVSRIERMGITENEKNIISQCVFTPDGSHCIKAQPVMIALGVIGEGLRADKCQRSLMRANLVPKELDLSTSAISSISALSTLGPSENNLNSALISVPNEQTRAISAISSISANAPSGSSENNLNSALISVPNEQTRATSAISSMSALSTLGGSENNLNLTKSENNSNSMLWTRDEMLCQEYIDCHVQEQSEFRYSYESSSRKGILRNDFQNTKMPNSTYALMKIQSMIDSDPASQVIDDMINNGIISKKDIKAFKKVAEVENVDISGMILPDSSSDDEE